MKTTKRILSIILSAVLLFAFTACKNGGDNTSDNNNGTNTGSTESVTIRYLNFKPESASIYKELAAAYEDETGNKVVVETAANNEYESTLTAKMATNEAPTLFQITDLRDMLTGRTTVLIYQIPNYIST